MVQRIIMLSTAIMIVTLIVSSNIFLYLFGNGTSNMTYAQMQSDKLRQPLEGLSRQ
jgi:hypothetical protein